MTQFLPENKILTKYLKRNFHFILEVSGYSVERNFNKNRNMSLILDVYVSPEHFCELLDTRVESKVVDKISKYSSGFIKSIITEWDQSTPIRVRFFPETNEATILKILEESEVEF